MVGPVVVINNKQCVIIKKQEHSSELKIAGY